MKKHTLRAIVALLLVFAMLFALAGCEADPRPAGSESESESESSSSSSSLPETTSSAGSSSGSASMDDGSSTDEFNSTVTSEVTSSTVKVTTIAEAKSYNSDVVGWLKVPNTTIDEPVVCYTKDINKYYLRRNWMGNSDYNGCYYGDYRGVYTTRTGLSNNTVIYGHSMDDSANGARFSQLKKFKDISFAKNNPYLYFSTENGEYVWQIFSVFITSTNISYNNPTVSSGQMLKLAQACAKKSLFKYDVSLSSSDKILTLSTCIYEYAGKKLSYPNDYRFVVMAKLLPANASLASSVSLSVNDTAKK